MEVHTGWIKVVGKGIEYAGKLAQAEGFEEWAENQGKAAIEVLAERLGYRFFKQHRAKGEIFKDLIPASEGLKKAIEAQVANFQRLLGAIAQKDQGLARSPGYPGVVAVPRAFHSGVARNILRKELGASNQLTQLKSGEAAKEYFFAELTNQMTRALLETRPSIKKPVDSFDRWLIIGADPEFDWCVRGPRGHFFLLQPSRIFAKEPRKDYDKDAQEHVSQELDRLAIILTRLSRDELLAMIKSIDPSGEYCESAP